MGKTLPEIISAAQLGVRMNAVDDQMLREGLLRPGEQPCFKGVRVFKDLVLAFEQGKLEWTDPVAQQLICDAHNAHANHPFGFAYTILAKVHHAFTHHLSGSAKQAARAEGGASTAGLDLDGRALVRLKYRTGGGKPGYTTDASVLKKICPSDTFLDGVVPLSQVEMMLKDSAHDDLYCFSLDGTHTKDSLGRTAGFTHGDATGFDNASADRRRDAYFDPFDKLGVFVGGSRKRNEPEIDLAKVGETTAPLRLLLNTLVNLAEEELPKMVEALAAKEDALTVKQATKARKDKAGGFEEWCAARRLRCQQELQGDIHRSKVQIAVVRSFVEAKGASHLARLACVAKTVYAMLDWSRVGMSEVLPLLRSFP